MSDPAIPGSSVPRIGSAEGDAPPESGLTSEEVLQRVAEGRDNVDTTRRRSDGDVIRANTVTFFNVVLAALIVALLAVGELRDGLFVGAVVAANVAIATLQGLRATHRLRELRALTEPQARVVRDGQERLIPAAQVVEDDLVHLRAGDQVVADGLITAQAAEIDEALLTGESDPMMRHAGDRLRAGSFCAAGDCYYRATGVGAGAYAVRLTAEARQSVRRVSPLMLRFRRVLRVLLIVTGLLAAVLFIQFNILDRGLAESLKATTATVTTVVPVGLVLAMTVVNTVGALRVSRSGAIVQDTYAVEALNYVDVVALDKTGTITSNRLEVEEIVWADGAEAAEPWIAEYARVSATDSRTAAALTPAFAAHEAAALVVRRVPFSSARRWSAAEISIAGETRVIILGAPEELLESVTADASPLGARYDDARRLGRRGVAFAEATALPDPDAPLPSLQPLALVTLREGLRAEAHGAFSLMAELGIQPKVISGDHPETVSALLKQLAVDLPSGAISGEALEALDDAALEEAAETFTVFGRVTPPLKARLIDALKRRGHYVAMVGDGGNDVLALRNADVAVAMASGTETARAVSGIVLLEDSFTALIRGTREATFVLGNTARLSKLFIAKSVYAYLLILATNMLGLEFPFLPRQGGVMSTLTLGLPAIFIAISVPPIRSRADFAPDVVRFALPAGLSLAMVAMVVQFVTEGLLEHPIEEARTLVSLTIGITGLAFVVEVVGLESPNWGRPWRPLLTIGMAVVLFGMLVLTVTVGWLRSFFAFTEVGGLEWILVAVAAAAALSGQYILSRYWREILRFIVAAPRADEVARGRGE